MTNTKQGTGTWWLQVCDEEGYPADCPVRVNPDTEGAILAELAELGLPWQEIPAPYAG